MGGESAGSPDRLTDPALRRAALAVAVGGVEEVDRAVKDGQNGFDGSLLLDCRTITEDEVEEVAAAVKACRSR